VAQKRTRDLAGAAIEMAHGVATVASAPLICDDRKMAAIALKVEQAPFIFSKFDGEPTNEELDDYIERFEAVHQRQEPYVTVAFMKRYARNQAHISRIARWMKEREDVARRYCIAACILTPSPAFRFILSAIFLIKPMPCPYQVCATLDDAVTFAQREAERRGLKLGTPHWPWDDAQP
jgi:hypothetical protein